MKLTEGWRRWLLRAVGMLVVAVLAVWGYRLLNPEPAYRERPVTAWIKELNDANLERQKAAFEAIRQIGPPAIPYLTRSPRLEDTRLKVWWQDDICIRLANTLPRPVYRKVPFRPPGGKIVGSGAANALGEMGEAARLAIPALLVWLNDPEPNIRSSAACALMKIAPDDSTVIAALTRLARSDPEKEMILHNVSNEFASFGTNQVAVVPLLDEVVRSSSDHARTNAVHALRYLAPHSEQARSALRLAAHSTDEAVRRIANETLNNLTPDR